MAQSCRGYAIAVLLGCMALISPSRVAAEVAELSVAKQYGVNYLQFMVMEDRKLIEKHAKMLGLGELKVKWLQFSSGSAMNDALLSGQLDFVSGGVGPFITLWARSKGTLDVKAVASMNSMPVVLVTRNPKVRSIKDFSQEDRIALPAVKVSIQAVTLQMAAARAFGDESYNKLDALTVSMSHPDGMAALLSGSSEITSHFTGPPFNTLELQKPGMRVVVHSYDVLGGKTTSTMVWATSRFREQNPKTFSAFVAALDEATNVINADKKAAAELYVKASNSKESAESIFRILAEPDIEYTLTPKNVTKYADFMFKVKSIKIKPAEWKEMFFPEIHHHAGS